jgi:hypothetical protein
MLSHGLDQLPAGERFSIRALNLKQKAREARMIEKNNQFFLAGFFGVSTGRAASLCGFGGVLSIRRRTSSGFGLAFLCAISAV